MNEFEIEFAKIYPEFTKDLNNKVNNLTSSEIKICMFIRMNYDSKSIQKHMGISKSTFFNSCSSIRKKLKIKRSVSLSNEIIST